MRIYNPNITGILRDTGGGAFNVKGFGARGDGVTNDTAAIQAAVNAAAGGQVIFPPGTYVITATIAYVTAANLAGGMHLEGAGQGKTIIDSRVANGPAFYCAGAANNFQHGPTIERMTIMTTAGAAVSHGIEFFAVWHATVRDVRITGLSGDAIRVTANLGDADASIEIIVENCRLELCNRGLATNFAAGIIGVSTLTMRGCYIVGNAVVGVRVEGTFQSLFEGNAFATNGGPGMQIAYGGLHHGQFVMLQNAFENNAGDPQLDIDGLVVGLFAGNEFALTIAPGAGVLGVRFANNGAATVQAVTFIGTRIRIVAAFNPYTMWTFGANSIGIRIIDPYYNPFDGAGQVRYAMNAAAVKCFIDEWASDALAQVDVVAVAGVNQNLAVPLVTGGTIYRVSGPAGAFNIGGLTNGFPSRKLVLYNSTAFVMTLNNNDAGSVAANRIRTGGGGALAIPALGMATLRYFFGEWHVG